jgi:hypothetical protein
LSIKSTRRIIMRNSGNFLLATAAAVLSATVGLAIAQPQIEVGVLECRGGSSTGLVVGSVSRYACVLREPGGIVVDRYDATIRRFGVDLGTVDRSSLAWAVYAPTRRLGRGDLAGNYAGAAGSASIGVGGGANALVGGSNNTISLQPFSVTGQVGVNVALGIADMELRPAP